MSTEKAPGSTEGGNCGTITLAALKVVGYGLAAIGPGIGIGVATLRPVRVRCTPA